MASLRPVLDSEHVHPSIRETIESAYRDTVDEVINAVASEEIVVVGMAQNPHVKKARRLLDGAGIPFRYLEYGSYLSEWRRRTAIKMWSHWPTFPMVFVGGTLIGGATELAATLESGELESLRSA